MADPEEEIDPNPPLVTYTKGDGYYDEEITHKDPPVHTRRVVIAELQAEVDKYEANVQLWQSKKLAPQAEIDRYNSLPAPGL